MTTDEHLKEIEKKVDILLSILGHGRTKSDAEIRRIADEKFREFQNKKHNTRKEARRPLSG